MAGVAGIIIPAELTRQGVLNVPAWYDAGKVYLESENAIPFGSLLMVQLFLHNFVEIKRWEDIKKPGSQAEPGSFLVRDRAAQPACACACTCLERATCVLSSWHPKLGSSSALPLCWLLLQGFESAFKGTGVSGYPGGPFNPLGLG